MTPLYVTLGVVAWLSWMAVMILLASRTLQGIVHQLSTTHSIQLREIATAFTEQAKSSNEAIAGVYTPDPGSGPVAAAPVALMSEPELPELFDDSDPTDAFIHPERPDGAFVDSAEPFGVPGLRVIRGEV